MIFIIFWLLRSNFKCRKCYIVDAEALKEAALRNAELAIIEKYEAEIKNAVTTLLEAPEDEDPFAEEDPLAMGAEPGLESDEAIADQLAMAGTDGEELCPCPDMEDPNTGGKVEIDLDQLVAAAAAEDDGYGSHWWNGS